MAYIFDLIIVGILVMSVIFAYRRGFVQSIVQFLGYIVAFVVALTLSTPVATFVFDGVLSEGIETKLTDTFVNFSDVTISEKVDQFLEELPAPIASALKNSDGVESTIIELNDTVELTGEKFAEALLKNAIRPVVISLMQIIIFIALFILLSIAIKLISKLFKPITKLPLIRQVDGILGAVLGLVKGVVFVLAFVSLLQLVAAVSPADGLITADMLDDSLLVGRIAAINPLSGVIA